MVDPPLPSTPYALQLLVDPPHDRVIVRMVEHDDGFGERYWRIYRLSTGKLEKHHSPVGGPSDPDKWVSILDARLIPDTPFILVHWFYKNRDYKIKDAGARFVLLGLGGRPVWSLDVDNDYVDIDLKRTRSGRGGPADYFRKHPAILSVEEPNRFDLRLFSENKRVTFEIGREGDDKVQVTELHRADYVEPDAAALLDAPKGTLRFLGEVSLLGAKSEPLRTGQLDRIAGFTVDHKDRLYAVACGTGSVHVFDRFGQRLRTLEPGPTDFAGTIGDAFIAVSDKGDVYVQRPYTQMYSPPDEYLRFSPGGERAEVVTFEPRLATSTWGPGWSFQPGTGYRVGLCPMEGDDRLMLIDPPDKVVWETRKRPNGEWFSFTVSIAVAPDGSIGVLSTDSRANPAAYEVDFFSATGDPIRTIPLPRARDRFTALAYENNKFVVVGLQEVLIGDAAGEIIERWSLDPITATERKWRAFLVADARELLLYEQGYYMEDRTPKLCRYELP